MKKDPLHHDPVDILGEAYEMMLERVMADFQKAKEKTTPVLHRLIDEARDKTSELGELTREEADRLAQYLKRDLSDAAQYMAETGGELKDWLGFETQLIENNLLDLLMQATDKTTVELLRLKEAASLASVYRTGEVTGPGTLVCDECGEKLHFRKAGRIPPCPKCHATAFHRAGRRELAH